MQKEDPLMEGNTEGRMMSGIRVLDFGRVISAPMCARNFADLGAEVIKVESGGGDLVRTHPPFYCNGSFGAIFTQYNAGKKGVYFDLRKPEGIELAKKLIAVSDVVVENFRPGVFEKMGLDYENLKKLNPRIIMCSISGFGQTSSERGRTAYADIIHAYSGMEYMTMRMMGEGVDPPGFAYSHADTYAALNATITVMAALFKRERTGEGQYIDLSLLDCAIAANDSTLQGFIFSEGAIDKPNMPKLPYRMKDGHMTVPAILAWNKLVLAMGRPELGEDPRFINDEVRMKPENAEELMKILKAWMAGVTVAEATALFEKYDIPHSKVNTLADVVNAPVVKERDMLVDVYLEPGKPPAKVMNCALRFDGYRVGPVGRPPFLGEHNAEVLRDVLGLKDEEIERLTREKIILRDPRAPQ
jgi:crotonobetainyl-CoA:carnitine CoA-transferase CaiB-like acyl-CoA transferase